MRRERPSRGKAAMLPWRAGPRAALTSPLVLVVTAVTALLSCFLAMAAVLHSSAAGGAAVADQADTVCPDAYGPVFTKPDVNRADVPVLVGAVRRQAAAHGFGEPVVSLFAPVDRDAEFAGDTYRVRYAYRDGGLDQLRLLRGDRTPGLWLGRDLAHAKDIPLGTRGEHGTLPPITGIYRDLYNPAPRSWCSVQDLAVQNRLVDVLTGSVIFATDRTTFDAATAGMPTLERLTITFAGPPPSTLGGAEERMDRSEALIAAVRDDLISGGHGDILHGGVPFARSVELAQQAQRNVTLSILPLAVLSVLIGCAGIGTVGVQWYQRRHAQVRLLVARGHGPLALGGLAVAELGTAVLGGGVTGMVLARVLLPVYGPPGTVGDDATWLGAGLGLAVLLVSLALPAAVVAVRAHREFELGRSAPRRRGRRVLASVPWEVGTAAFAVVGWTRLAEYGGTSRSADPLPQVDPLALTYPVAVVLTVGLVAARVTLVALHLSRRARFWSRPALQLAIRRLASARAPVTGVLVIAVLAVGTLAVGTSVAAAQRHALDDKTGVLVGAESAVDVENVVGTGEVALPAPIREESTLVGRLSGTGSVVLVVDPGTFSDIAWTRQLDEDHLRGLLDRISRPVTGAVPAIRIGHSEDRTTALPGLPDADVVADLDVFPLLGDRPGYVVSRTALTATQLQTVPQWTALSTAPLAELAGAFRQAGLAHPNAAGRDTVLDALPFQVVGWTFSFVTVLGTVLGVVAVLALLVAVETRRRQNALAGALVLRMGLRPGALLRSHLLELGAVAGFATLTGLAGGVTVAGVSVRQFDPARWLAPGSELPDLVPFVAAVCAAGAAVVAVAGWLAVRSVRTSVPAEVLRG